MVRFRYSHVAFAAYCLLIVPVLIFFFGWLRWFYALPAAIALLLGFAWLYLTDYRDKDDAIEIPVRHFVLLLLAIGAFVALSGNCGFYRGGYDIPWRNAILRDLIDFQWPVVYSTGFALAYYFIFWMVPALVGKLFGWAAAMIALWVWQVLIVGVSFLLIVRLVGATTPSRYWMVLVLFLFWSGLNLIGAIASQAVGYYQIDLSYNENYAGRFYYRGNIDCIEETYNQIVIWMAVPLMLQNRRIHSYLFLGLLLLPFSPWLLAGIIPYMLALGVMEVAEGVHGQGGAKTFRTTLKAILSPANIAALLACGVVFLAFFAASMQGAGEVTDMGGGGAMGLLDLSGFSAFKWAGFLVFVMCEFGIYCLFLFKRFRRDPLYWVTVVWLLIAPFIWVGLKDGVDFGMDASLPALTVLMVYVIIFFKEDVMGRPLRFWNCVFVMLLATALLGGVMEFAGRTETLVSERTLSSICESTDILTYDGLPYRACDVFVCPRPSESFFFATLAR